MFCPRCGTKLAEGSRFCYRCGCRLADYVPELADTYEETTEPVPPDQAAAWGEPRPAAEHVPTPAEAEAEPVARGPAILIDLSHKERIHEGHWQALRTRLEEEGRVTVRKRRPVNPALLRGKRLLVIGGPEHRWVFGRGADRWEDEEVRAIERFVARGNGLLVLGDGLASVEALSAVTAPYGITFSADPVGSVTLSDEDVRVHRITRGVDEICLGSVRGVGGNYLQVEEPAAVLAEHQGRAVMAYAEHEEGRVIVLSSLSAFSQKCLEEKDNPVLLDSILRYLLHWAPHYGETRPAREPVPSESVAAPEVLPEPGSLPAAGGPSALRHEGPYPREEDEAEPGEADDATSNEFLPEDEDEDQGPGF